MLRPTRAIVDLAAIAHNVRHLRADLRPGVRFMAVVKADAYGHGAVPVARTALAAGADWLGVALVEEGLHLRRAGVEAPILVLGPVPPGGADAAAAHGLTATVTSGGGLAELERAGAALERTIAAHLKLDTGMARIGVAPDRAVELARAAAVCPHVDLQGVYSHLAAADSPALREFTRLQMTRWHTALDALEAAGVRPRLRHLANSAGLLELPAIQLDMVRGGISLYGVDPVDRPAPPVPLMPALTWVTRIALLKEVPAGTAVSYGCTFTTARPTRIATLPVGYADGYPRGLSNRASVLVAGRRAPVIGRVCMDMLMVDVTDVPEAAEGSEVVLLGAQADQRVSAGDLAAGIDTIAYEILCGIGPRVPRTYRPAPEAPAAA